jgi:hypothetical protein
MKAIDAEKRRREEKRRRKRKEIYIYICRFFSFIRTSRFSLFFFLSIFYSKSKSNLFSIEK